MALGRKADGALAWMLGSLLSVLGCGEQPAQKAESSVQLTRKDVATVPGDEGDRALIEHMQKSGVDLGRPHLVDFIFVGPKAALEGVCADMIKQEYKVAIEPPGVAHSTPICRATKSMTVTLESMTKLRAEHEASAATFGAELDGWELDPR